MEISLTLTSPQVFPSFLPFLGALLDIEHKLSLVNCLVQKSPYCSEVPVKSRDEFILQCGMWRRPVRPVFSENNLNSDKHKLERFLNPNQWVVASSYGPITFGRNVPVLMFRSSEEEPQEL